MESLEQTSKQLENIGELRSIVKTMKALAMANIKQYEQAVTALSDYYQTVELGLRVVLKDFVELPSSTEPKPNTEGFAAIIFGSDHGLCGRFNEEIAEHAMKRLKSIEADINDIHILTVGVRVAASLNLMGQNIEEKMFTPGSSSQIVKSAERILLKMDEWREKDNVKNIYLFYNRHTEEKKYISVDKQLLPMSPKPFQELKKDPWPSRRLPTYTMDRKKLLSQLLHQYLFVSISRACAESQSSEHSSRLEAMQTAESNLDERMEELSMKHNRARQNKITSELLEVVSGFETLTKS